MISADDGSPRCLAQISDELAAVVVVAVVEVATEKTVGVAVERIGMALQTMARMDSMHSPVA